MEIIDIVDNKDNIIWQINRKESYKKYTTNRVVSVLIFNSDWKLALHKRASTCSFMPWAWAISAWWHVWTWETYKIAAKKELKEELWIECDLKFVDKLYEDRKILNWKNHIWNKSHFYFESIYEWLYDWEFNFDR